MPKTAEGVTPEDTGAEMGSPTVASQGPAASSSGAGVVSNSEVLALKQKLREAEERLEIVLTIFGCPHQPWAGQC